MDLAVQLIRRATSPWKPTCRCGILAGGMLEAGGARVLVFRRIATHFRQPRCLQASHVERSKLKMSDDNN